ncbi:hypothetical protein DL95DRAFT_392261 [Leptodontidium sp. 2 PMI_412]|nr:hypothetical protein BKA61DRAFT_678730 [Leptodontidium sp. MPI-SDFR-AT-0119]KAH9211698.1 hypothetical protein DL95DRAFT_392261 [Leptodontidium sp. 2 PMI_412]
MFLSPFKQMKKAINRICLQKILDTADLAVQSQLRIAEDLHTQARWIDREFNSIESVLLEFYAAYLPLRDLERGYIFDEDVVDIGPDPDVYNTNGRQERSHGSELQTRHEGQGGKQQQRLQYDQQQERRRLRQDQQQFQNNQQDQRDQYQQQQHQPRLLNNKLPPITIHGHSISYSSLSPRTIRRLNTFLRPSTDPLLHTHFSALTDSMRAQFPALRNRSDTDGETATHELRGGNHYPSIYLPAAFTGRRNATREVVRGDREVLCLMEGELRGAREGVRVLKEAVEEMDLIKVHEEVWGRGEGDTRRADMCTSEEEDIRDMFREMKASLKRALKRWKKEEEQKKTNPNLNLNRVEKELRRMFPFDAPPLLEKKA